MWRICTGLLHATHAIASNLCAMRACMCYNSDALHAHAHCDYAIVPLIKSLLLPYCPHAMLALPPAPNKLDIHQYLGLRNFRATDLQLLSRLSDIHRWYSALHSRGRVCGVYYSPWESHNKNYCMVDTWCLASLYQEIIDREALMSVALHSLLSSKGIFSGKCADFVHLVSNIKGDGYLALYQFFT
jgi:hypothetical protein